MKLHTMHCLKRKHACFASSRPEVDVDSLTRAALCMAAAVRKTNRPLWQTRVQRPLCTSCQAIEASIVATYPASICDDGLSCVQLPEKQTCNCDAVLSTCWKGLEWCRSGHARRPVLCRCSKTNSLGTQGHCWRCTVGAAPAYIAEIAADGVACVIGAGTLLVENCGEACTPACRAEYKFW